MRVSIPARAINPCYRPLLRDSSHRYLVLYGGAGSGKSVFAVQRLLVRLLEQPMCNLLVIRATAVSHRDSTYALFRQTIAAWGLGALFRCSNSSMRVVCLNGNQVVFKGLDDPEKLKSITFPKGDLTDVWVEEASEITQAQFNQLDLRLRGQGPHRQMTLTFNPVSAMHWLKKRFFDHPDGRAAVLKTTYQDNRFLDQAYRQTLESYRVSDPYYYQVYCLGEWGVLGRTVFHQGNVMERLAHLAPPVDRGEFLFSGAHGLIDPGSIRFFSQDQGSISVYRRPERGVAYVIGGDTAGEGSDYFGAQVVRLDTGEQVCTLRGQMDEDLYAQQLFCLGIWYNRALVAVESNFSSYPIRRLEQLGYPRQYAGANGSLGFRTTSATRPVILARLVEIVREHPAWLNDGDTLGEMLTFVRSSRGRAEAQAGAHDDCVMALAIAYHVREEGIKDQGAWSCWVERI